VNTRGYFFLQPPLECDGLANPLGSLSLLGSHRMKTRTFFADGLIAVKALPSALKVSQYLLLDIVTLLTSEPHSLSEIEWD